MAIQFTTYDPYKVIVTYNGLDFQGFAEGTFVEAERLQDGFTMKVGATGDVTRVKNRDRTGKVTVTLMAASPTNDLLGQFYFLDEQDDVFDGGALQIKDMNGNMKCHADAAWIMKLPKIERGKDAQNVQWVFECADLDITPGGNESAI